MKLTVPLRVSSVAHDRWVVLAFTTDSHQAIALRTVQLHRTAPFCCLDTSLHLFIQTKEARTYFSSAVFSAPIEAGPLLKKAWLRVKCHPV
jgi:hypothetical protein